MDTMSSTEFRRRYASITERTVVQVNGHSIGIWTPRSDMTVDDFTVDVPVVDGVATLPDGRTVESSAQTVRVPLDRFNSRPFTPVPKTRK